MAFDVAGAKAAGYSDQEIQQFLQQQQPAAATKMFDAAGAKAAGYSDQEIQQFLQQQQQPATNPAADMSTGQRVLAGVGSGMTDVGQGLRQLMAEIGPEKYAKVLGSLPFIGPALEQAARSAPVQQFLDPAAAQAAIDEKRRIDKPLLDTTAGTVGNVVGRIAATAPLAMALPGTTVAATAGQGALMGALEPVATGENRGQNIVSGAMGGAIGGAAMKGLARLLSPRASTDPAIQQLLSEGITPTVGKLGGSTTSRLEDASASIPFVGDIIRKGQQAAGTEFQRAALNRVLEPLGVKLKDTAPVGHEGVRDVGEFVSKAYENLLPQMSVKSDAQLISDLASVRMAARNLPPDKANQFDDILNNLLLSRFQRPTGGPAGQWNPYELSGDALKQAQSDLREHITPFAKSTAGDDRILAQRLQDVQGALRAAVARSNPNEAPVLNAIDRAYANLGIVENAAGRSVSGEITPAQLAAAAKAKDISKGRRRFGRGTAMDQDLAQAGAILRQTEPNSGTPYRMAIEAALVGGAAAAAPGLLYALPTAAGLYSDAGRKAMAMLLARRPEWAARFAQQLQQRGMPLAASVGAQQELSQ